MYLLMRRTSVVGLVLSILSIPFRSVTSCTDLAQFSDHEASEQCPWYPVQGAGADYDGYTKVDRKGGCSTGAGHPKVHEGTQYRLFYATDAEFLGEWRW